MYQQDLIKVLTDYVKPKVLAKKIGIKNGSTVTIKNMTL